MDKLEKAATAYFSQKTGIVCLILFGSYAEERATETSDVDLAVLFSEPHVPDPMTLIEWRGDLSILLNKEVDLVCLNTASPIIGMQVYKNGRFLIQNDQRKYDDYQIRLFIDYAELKEIRAPMEQDILKRKYYGP